MDYRYDNGVELLLAHMNIEDIITATERLYQLEEEQVADGVQYGTVTDLLSFVNRLSNMQSAALKPSSKEVGVLLNKVREINPTQKCFCRSLLPDSISFYCFF
ncbi:unnamed protein product [Tetraodon nigroviridis]|uniref:(spotted green pufferfish) hypothetical protein n=1 Tax=Tetraodon nigroviridis TaxID=99883 RepID=Q4SKT4_TETNG|nr:unnamed protein product [Tetraodon nigroviridis]